jgi:hypothetical protein
LNPCAGDGRNGAGADHSEYRPRHDDWPLNESEASSIKIRNK